MNILVHACYINPQKGSEFSVSWNYVVEMSKRHHLYVLVGSTTEDLGDYSGLNGVTLPNVDFIFPDTGRLFKIANWFYHAVLHYAGAWTRYIAYTFWNRHTYRALKADCDMLSKIDVVHFLSPVGWHEIGWLYKLGKPCIWGPVGGFTNCRREFYSHYVMTRGRKITLKNISNSLSALASCHVRHAMKSYDLVIANTTDTKRFIERHYKVRNLAYFPENSMRITEREIKDEMAVLQKYDALLSAKSRINCIWCGSLFDGKMPGMLLDIVKLMKNRLYIKMVGGGYLKDYLQNRIQSEGLSDRVELCGLLPREEVRAQFASSHLHVLTSAYEANTTVMFEAMEECVPSIVFDHFGLYDLVKDGKTGRKIPVADYETMCRSFAAALDEICEKPELLGVWAKNLREDSRRYTAEKRAEFFEECYSLAMKNHGTSR